MKTRNSYLDYEMFLKFIVVFDTEDPNFDLEKVINFASGSM